MAQTMIGTVPTPAEAAGDFSESGVDDLRSAQFPRRIRTSIPAGPSAPRIRRSFATPFPGNIIPADAAESRGRSHAAEVRAPAQHHGRHGHGHDHDGSSHRVRSGNRTRTTTWMCATCSTVNDQGTIRVDRVFNEANTLSVRYSVSSEDGFMPQNLPGFGFNHDNLAQNASVIYTRVLSPSW